MDPFQDQVERQVAKCHRDDRVDRVRVAAAHHVAQFLVNGIDRFAIVILGGKFLDAASHQVADAAQLGMTIGIRGAVCKDHLAALEHCAFRDQHHRVAAGVVIAVIDHQFGQLFDVELAFRDNAAVRRAGHGRQHGRKTGITPENLQDHEALVRAGNGAQAVGQGDGAGNTGAEADAIIGARHIVIHRFWDGNDLEALLVKANAVAERVIPADGYQVINPQEIQIFDHFGGQIVALGIVTYPSNVSGHFPFAHFAWFRARGMQEGASRTPGFVDNFLGQNLEIIAIISILIPDDFRHPGPTASQADHLVALADRTNRNGADGWIQSRDISATSQDANHSRFFFAHLLLLDVKMIAIGGNYNPREYNYKEERETHAIG